MAEKRFLIYRGRLHLAAPRNIIDFVDALELTATKVGVADEPTPLVTKNR